MSWGPGKFDADLNLDGKAFRPDGKPAATLVPLAFGIAGVNLHTWTGPLSTVTYWNAFVGELGAAGSVMRRRYSPSRDGIRIKQASPSMIFRPSVHRNSYRTAPLDGLFAH